MSGWELPAGWEEVPLAEIATSQLGKMLDKAKWTAGTSLPYLRNVNVRWGEFDLSDLLEMPFTVDELDRYGLRDGDVLICEGGEPGRAAIWLGGDTPIKYQKALHRVRLQGGCDPRWLVFQLRKDATGDRLSAFFTGTTIKHFTGEALSRYPVALPPLPEQRRIVEKIEALTARSRRAREALDTLPALIDRYRQSILAAAFRGDLTKDWRVKETKRDYPSHTLNSSIVADTDAQLPILPMGWKWCNLSDLIDTQRPLCYGVVQPGEEDDSGNRLIRVCDIGAGVVNAADLRTISADVDRQYKRSRVRAGDVLVSIVGTIGRSAVVQLDADGANIARALARVSPRPQVPGKWISYWLSTYFMQSWLVRESREVARKTLNLGELAQAPVPLAPSDEMATLVQILDSSMLRVGVLSGVVAEARERIPTLDQSILAKAFRGELVPQDPNDEPASVLLERIRAERAAAGEKPRRGRARKAG